MLLRSIMWRAWTELRNVSSPASVADCDCRSRMRNSRQCASRLVLLAAVLAALAGQSLAQPPDIQGQWEIEYKVSHGISAQFPTLLFRLCRPGPRFAHLLSFQQQRPRHCCLTHSLFDDVARGKSVPA